jgi:U3 small nucleolar RNA-associated protein 4
MSVVVTPAALSANTVITKVVNPLATSVEATFEESYHRKLAYTSGMAMKSAVAIARKARLIMCLSDAGVTIWRILEKKRLEDSRDSTESGDDGGWEKVLEMELNVHTNLIAGAISDDGKWLAVSDLYEAKLFNIEDSGKVPFFISCFTNALRKIIQLGGDIRPKRIRDFASILQVQLPGSPAATGASAFSFTPDSSKLVMTTTMTSYVLVLELPPSLIEKPRVLQRFDHHRIRNADRVFRGQPTRSTNGDVSMDEADDNEDTRPIVVNISRIAISSDGQWLATSDDRARTQIFNLDSVKVRWAYLLFILPLTSYAAPPHTPVFLSTRACPCL